MGLTYFSLLVHLSYNLVAADGLHFKRRRLLVRISAKVTGTYRRENQSAGHLCLTKQALKKFLGDN